MYVLENKCRVLLNLIAKSRPCCILLDDGVSKLQQAKGDERDENSML